MMHWVLIVFVNATGNDTSFLQMQDFNSESSCMAAKQLVQSKIRGPDILECVKK